MNYYERAKELTEESISNRRFLHQNPEIGLELPITTGFVMEKLSEYGLSPQICGKGISAIIGGSGRTILLRADMDALPMPEETELSFASTNGHAHACGHDLHTAMLLTAAKLLKENEAALAGTVKFMFQPAEEIFQGSRHMIENGVLLDPAVDVALAFHVAAGKAPVGTLLYNSQGTMMFSADGFKITIHGKGSHGAYPHMGIDPINIASHIYLGLQELIARESDPTHACVLTIGRFQAGTAANIIPDSAVLEGTLRTNQPVSRALLVKRLQEVALRTAEVFGGTAEIEMTSEVPPLICDPSFTDETIELMSEMKVPGLYASPGISASASEDFAFIAEQVPSAFIYLGAGFSDERSNYNAHHPKVQFNEEVLSLGSSMFAHVATRWLEKHKD